jgi:aminoglycoside N3'-acetyltransferase
MPVPITTARDLDNHFAALGLQPGDRVVVHSRLIAFGRIEGGAATVMQALQASVGARGTIAVPTYTLEPSAPYDPRTTPSQGMGPLSEYVRLLPNAVRSACPLHNHAAVGPDAGVLKTASDHVSLGTGSDFDVLHREGFKLLLLGAAFSDGATFLHHLEAVAGVPYRTWVTLPRAVVGEDGAVGTRDVQYYGRDDARWREDFDRVLAPLQSAQIVTSAPCPFGHSHFGALAAISAYVLGLLRADPYALVRRGEG